MYSINTLLPGAMCSLFDRALNFSSKLSVRVARLAGSCHPPLLRWADQKQNRQRVMSQLKTIYDKDKLYREFSEYKHQPLNKHQFKHISNFAEFIALKEGIKNSLVTENIRFETQLAYATANSIVEPQAPLLTQKVIDASKNLSASPPQIIQTIENQDNKEADKEKAKKLLTILMEQVIREEFHKNGSGLSQAQLESKATLILARLNNPADYANDSFEKFKNTIHSQSTINESTINESTINKSTTSETLAALRELSEALELKHFVKGKPFEGPQDRLKYLTEQFNEMLQADKSKAKDPQKWIDKLIQRPVIKHCWELSICGNFLTDVQEQIENTISKDASYQACSSAGRDKILIESLLNAMSDHVDENSRNKISQWMDKTVKADDKKAANSVSQDFWEALTNQVSKETSISIAALRDSMPDETAQSIIRI